MSPEPFVYLFAGIAFAIVTRMPASMRERRLKKRITELQADLTRYLNRARDERQCRENLQHAVLAGVVRANAESNRITAAFLERRQ